MKDITATVIVVLNVMPCDRLSGVECLDHGLAAPECRRGEDDPSGLFT
jgi:hypothetical protein